MLLAVNMFLVVVGLCQLSLVWGLCAQEPDWIEAFCHSNKQGSDHIFFLGTVSKKDVPVNERVEETVYTFRVEKKFGGSIEANQQLIVHSSPISGIGKLLQQGTKYLIEAHVEAQHDEYEIDTCDYASFGDGYEPWQLEEMRKPSFYQDWCFF
ncbi:uncharacterized protein [Amphiura filiformis]|uniref:uncharacterized protein n=1 Tax=Amphiura filiformis TaxID=82378 RepID=UPI003B2232F4